ncbi:hypothetical protein MLD38_006812 [Melastoma candidum]|uniref:Uncharacterized protein n=1 Tax=Melastoma candidum TaxID=119954 RepID=A0ACB9RPM4_9MYRT|nr:hypothetical protein MLD38_006812 [Melastoma candidum]
MSVGTGSVMALSSLFPPEEAHKAARRVEDAIAERQKEVERLKEFFADTTPSSVPFGKSDLLPGSVSPHERVYGEEYYAERTSKETVEILKRRRKALDANVQSLKSMIEDLIRLTFPSSTEDYSPSLILVKCWALSDEDGHSKQGREGGGGWNGFLGLVDFANRVIVVALLLSLPLDRLRAQASGFASARCCGFGFSRVDVLGGYGIRKLPQSDFSGNSSVRPASD